jgi:mono/diheme cytochrome c family protein
MTGEDTEGGSFATPALSFDGQRLAFAYVECRGRPTHEFHLEPQVRGYWDHGRAYHIFSVGLDGTGLTMLTDGGWNDFSPCWTPAGRLAFISERRGGYLRCGRVCPNYTLYDMAADGSGIRPLSHHDTNEWAPAIAHDGRIAWTRWDYVDRDAEVAHHPWTTTPDGRDARSMHGNYSPRAARADMETDLQPIPGSRRFIGTAAPHHGQSFGSLVVIDPGTPDDDRMAPVRRFTPEVGFPESQGGSLSYGTPWPLHERYHLCAYEPVEVRGVGRAFHFGIYLVDAFGNKELVYHDPDIACVNPILLRARPVPPVIADQRVAANDSTPDADATVTVLDVYQGLKPWPEGTRIRALRIWQLLPFNVPSLGAPHNIGIQQPGTNSISLARAVVGEVPVEADGSAFFKVPAGRQLFFQALDDKGLAVQSMRAGAYFHPGERASCIGCHEPRDGAPPAPATGTLLALRREPSVPKPSFDGANPFSYPRLVQPVLDAKCAGCHAENGGPPLTRDLVRVPGNGMNLTTTYYGSYLSLAPFTFNNYDDPHRTTPGKFGARASKLHQMLAEDHHGLQLTDEEMARIRLWLDSRAQFYGTYHRDGGEAQLRGKVVRPLLE